MIFWIRHTEKQQDNIMKRFLVILFLGVWGSCSITSAQKDVSLWATVPVVVDGNNVEWPEFERFRNPVIGINYDIRNDQDHVYLLFRIPDGLLQTRLMFAGLKVSLKTKSSPRAYIAFPAMSPGTTNNENLTVEIKAVADKYKKLLEKETEVRGFAHKDKSATTAGEKNASVTYAMSWSEEGGLIYEIGIPLCELYGDKYVFSKITRNVIGLRLESEAFTASVIVNEEDGNPGEHSEISVHHADEVSGPQLECKFTLAEHN